MVKRIKIKSSSKPLIATGFYLSKYILKIYTDFFDDCVENKP
jgi:hypothetical protein